MSLELTSSPTFAGHQTFHPRFGWLRKAYSGVKDDPAIFSRIDATVRLGVGKNMVEAIRFWGQAAKVIRVAEFNADTRGRAFEATSFGHFLFDDDAGLDPYLESDSSLWILHWKMLEAPNSVPIWWIIFDAFAGLEFTAQDMVHVVNEAIASTTWKQPSPGSIVKDIDALIRMYSSRESRARQTIDDMLDSPFRAMGMIQKSVSTSDGHRFIIGKKPGLTPSVIAYACVDFLLRSGSESAIASIPRLSRDSGSPGRLFKIDEKTLIEALAIVADEDSSVSLVDKAGTLQFVVSDLRPGLSEALLAREIGWRN